MKGGDDVVVLHVDFCRGREDWVGLVSRELLLTGCMILE